MTQQTSSQTARKPRNRILLGGCLAGFLLLGLTLWFCGGQYISGYVFALGKESVENSQINTAPPIQMVLPVVAISSQNMSRVVEVKRLSPTDPVTLFAWSPDSRVLAMGHEGGVDFWDVSEERRVGSLSVGPAVKSIAFSPNGTMLAVSRGLVTLYDVASGSEIRTFKGEEIQKVIQVGKEGATTPYPYTLKGDVAHIAFSPDGTRLAGGMKDNHVIVWDVSSGDKLRIFSDPASELSSEYAHPDFSPDGKRLAMGGIRNAIVWDVETGSLLSTRHGAFYFYTVFGFLSDGKTLAIDSGLVDLTTGAFAEWNSRGDCMSVSPDGSVLAFNNYAPPDFSVENPGLKIVSQQVKGRERKLGPRTRSCPTAFSLDGRLLASGPGPVSLWGVAP